MDNVIRIAKRLIPIEQIALFEPFIAPTDPPLRTEKEFKARIVLLDRVSILSEETPKNWQKRTPFDLLTRIALRRTRLWRSRSRSLSLPRISNP